VSRIVYKPKVKLVVKDRNRSQIKKMVVLKGRAVLGPGIVIETAFTGTGKTGFGNVVAVDARDVSLQNEPRKQTREKCNGSDDDERAEDRGNHDACNVASGEAGRRAGLVAAAGGAVGTLLRSESFSEK